MPDEINARDLLITLNEHAKQQSAQIREMQTQLKRGGERFARLDLIQQGTDAEFARLRTDYSRAMQATEQNVARIQDLDRQVGASLRLASKNQQDLAALAKRDEDDDRRTEGRMRLLAWAIGGVGALVLAIEIVRYARKR